MPLFSWFDTRTVDGFVDTLVNDFMHQAPASALSPDKPATGKTEARLRKAHDQALVKAAEFTREHRPNFYQKARLASQVKLTLKDAGYPDWFIREFAYALAAVAASANSQRTL